MRPGQILGRPGPVFGSARTGVVGDLPDPPSATEHRPAIMTALAALEAEFVRAMRPMNDELEKRLAEVANRTPGG